MLSSEGEEGARPSGWKRRDLDEERAIRRKGLGCRACSCLISSAPTRPTPTMATRKVFEADVMLSADAMAVVVEESRQRP